MNRSSIVAADVLPVEHRPLPAHLAVTPAVTTGNVQLDSIAGIVGGVWEHSCGVSTDVEQDEMFVIIAGRGRIVLEDGSVLALQPGTVGLLRAGEKTRWEIEEPLRKVWFAVDA